MNKLNVPKLINDVQIMIKKRTPEILTGIGIAGMVTTTVLAVKATPKALTMIEEEKRELNDALHREAKEKNLDSYAEVNRLKPIEIIKATWKCYIPAVVTCIGSIICLIGASSVNMRRNAALATAYEISKTALTEYREKVVETIGEKKEQVIRDKIAEEHVEKNPVTKGDVIITDKGNTLCYDNHSGRYFKSDIDKIKKAVNEVNRLMLRDDYISLNDFYDELGLEHTKIGDKLGWNINDGFLELNFSSQIADDGTPCLVIDYEEAPQYGFSSFA